MEEKHREIVEDLFSKISFALAESGRVPPLFIMVLQDDTVMPIILGQTEIDMIEYASASMEAASDMDAKALILSCEQYMVSRNKGDADIDDLMNGIIKPSEHPDKAEYLTLIYMTSDGDYDSLISKIHTDPRGTRYTADFKWVDDSVSNIIQPWK
jgi:hypothetical protein